MSDSITVERLNQMLKKKDAFTVLDVRRKDAYQDSDHIITRAKWQDPENIDSWIDTLAADQQTIVYCVKGGPVSQSVNDELNKRGFQSAYLAGGIKRWTEKEFPVDKKA